MCRKKLYKIFEVFFIWCSVSCRTRLAGGKRITSIIDLDLSDLLNTRSILGFIAIVFNS